MGRAGLGRARLHGRRAGVPQFECLASCGCLDQLGVSLVIAVVMRLALHARNALSPDAPFLVWDLLPRDVRYFGTTSPPSCLRWAASATTMRHDQRR